MKKTTWPRIDIEKEKESIIGLFFVPYFFSVCSLFVKYTYMYRFELLVFEMLVKYLHVCEYLNYK